MQTTEPPRALAAAAFTLLIAAGLPASSGAAFDLPWPTAREAGLSGVCVPPEGPGVTVSGGELYGLSEAVGASSTVTARVGASTVALELSQFGGELYRERSLGLSLRGDLASDLSGGVCVRALCLGARGLGDRWTVAVDADASRRLLGRVHLAAGCRNLAGAMIGGSPAAQEAQAGVSLLLPEMTMHARITADGVCRASYTLAFELPVSEWLRARAGATTSPGTFSVGLGIGRSRERSEHTTGRRRPSVDMAWQWHPQLGVSSFVSVSFHL